MNGADIGRALRQKDTPWLLLFSFGGAITLLATLADGGLFNSLVMPPGRSESEFHAAWICGLALGITVASFDVAVLMGDHLRQRPISAEQLFWHRIRSMGRVLAVWFVGVPIAAWIWMATFEGAHAPDSFALAQYWIAVLPAGSAAAIGFAALSLPLVWWLRLVVGAAAFFIAFSVDYELTLLAYSREAAFQGAAMLVHVVLHVLFTVLAIAAARAVRGRSFDPDFAPPAGLRSLGGLFGVLALAAVGQFCVLQAEVAAARELRSAYPRVVLHDGAVKLVDPEWGWRERRRRFVDREHALTGEDAPRDEIADFSSRQTPPSGVAQLGFDAPSWHRYPSDAGFGDLRLYLDYRGHGWLRDDRGRAALEPIGKGDDGTPFIPGSRLHQDWSSSRTCFVHEPGSGRVYLFDPDNRRFRVLALPKQEAVERVGYTDLPLGLLTSETRRQSRVVLRCESASYVFNGDELVELPEQPTEQPRRDRAPIAWSGGPVIFHIELEARDSHPAFEHTYRPHTPTEYALATLVGVLASVQPPCYVAWFHSTAFESPNTWIYVALALAVAILSGGVAGRRLRRLGAPPRVRQYWLWLTVILGPIALLLSILFERPRAYRDRPRFDAVRPRVFTQPELQEKAS